MDETEENQITSSTDLEERNYNNKLKLQHKHCPSECYPCYRISVEQMHEFFDYFSPGRHQTELYTEETFVRFTQLYLELYENYRKCRLEHDVKTPRYACVKCKTACNKAIEKFLEKWRHITFEDLPFIAKYFVEIVTTWASCGYCVID